ncbi:O-antigen ligase family protein [Altererythrobacter sp. BO-6]|uniref:O-antigen ligase family protein n=1 Tax=Altererythrobacter sp. BO-6 TaxID=2604537 RepID=UPI0013E10398|nr:O-antigen ligase family protein [Altererythrobacter sp. BO-6]QIG54280.1 O-antigen ligase family protein [Altererythrobacter sp. BO-6]
MSSWSPQLAVLALFLALLFLTGGSSRADVSKLIVLRPLAVLAAGYGLATIRKEDFATYRPIWLLFGAVVLLTVAHLVPLPPGVWQSLPGREILVEIDTLAGLEGIWRPLSMHPEGTWNALYALSVPFAALLLASQLGEEDRMRLLAVVIVLCMLSGFVGVIQAGGTDIRFYRFAGDASGFFANRNHQAAMLACLFPMLAAIALSAGRFKIDPRATRLIAAAGMIALVPLILVTGSRMGLIVGAISFMSLAFMFFSGAKRSDAFAIGRLIQGAVALLIAAGMVAGTVFMARDKAFDRVDGLANEPRIPAWESIVDFLPSYLPWGSGIGSFVPVYQIHEESRLLMEQYFNQAHNDWLDLVLTAGLPGVILALVAAVMFVVAAKAALGARSAAGHLRRAGVIVILLLAFASVTDYPLRTPILSALLAIAAIWAWSPFSQSQVKESNQRDA